jgi:hypothetical protein
MTQSLVASEHPRATPMAIGAAEASAFRFDWPPDPVMPAAAQDGEATGWAALDEPEEKDRRRWLLLLLLLPLLLLIGWLWEQAMQPVPVLSLAIATDGVLAPPQNQVFSGQTLGPEHLTITNTGNVGACWWISAQGDNPSLGKLIAIRVTDAAGGPLYAGAIPDSSSAVLFGSACARPPIGVQSGTQTTLAPGASATLTIDGRVGDLPPALDGQILTITWSSVSARAGQ